MHKIMKQIKLNRNNLCWCGSEKKYKLCHLKEDQDQGIERNFIARSKEFEEGMLKANQLAKDILNKLGDLLKPGITTNYLEQVAQQLMLKNGAKSASLGYRGYPKAICTSVNYVICHGIPNDIQLQEGDLISIDVACILNGYYGDTCKTFLLPNASLQAQKLVKVTLECLELAIKAVKVYGNLGDLGYAIQSHAEQNGYSVVDQFVGHGIGTVFHDNLQVPHFGEKGKGTLIIPGMCFTIEPMINEGVKEARILQDKWTAITVDKKLSAQFEHTILLKEDGTVAVLSK